MCFLCRRAEVLVALPWVLQFLGAFETPSKYGRSFMCTRTYSTGVCLLVDVVRVELQGAKSSSGC